MGPKEILVFFHCSGFHFFPLEFSLSRHNAVMPRLRPGSSWGHPGGWCAGELLAEGTHICCGGVGRRRAFISGSTDGGPARKAGAPVCLAPYLCKRASGWMAQGMGQEPLSGLPRGAGAGPVWSAPPQAKKAPELLTFTQGHSGGPSMSVHGLCPAPTSPFLSSVCVLGGTNDHSPAAGLGRGPLT